MAIDMTKIKHILFTLFSIGNMQTLVTDKPDGSVSCLIFVTSLIGFFFPVLEIYESPISFERYFLQFSCGCLCLLSTAAWIHLLHCYKKQPQVYLDCSIPMIDPAARLLYRFLFIFTFGIFLYQGLNCILDITCYQKLHEYHYFSACFNRITHICFCSIQTLVLITLTQSKFQNKLKVNYVLALAMLTNGILWMFTSLRMAKGHLPIDRINNTSDLAACYYESKIYANILSPVNKIAMQIHSKYFIICIGLIASILPTSIPSKDTDEGEPKESQSCDRNQRNGERFLRQSLIVTCCSFAPFIPCLVVLVLTQWTRPPEVEEIEYLRIWWLSSALIPNALLIVATYRGLHRVKYLPIKNSVHNHEAKRWVFKNDVLSIICFMGDNCFCVLSWHRETGRSAFFELTLLRFSYIYQLFVQTVFLLILERITVDYFQKIKHIALFLCVGNLVLWFYPEYLVPSGTTLKEIPPELEQIIFSLSSMNRFLSFVRFYRIYSISH